MDLNKIELDYLKDGEILAKKLEEVFSFFEGRGIKAIYSDYYKYKNGILTVEMAFSVSAN